MGNRGHELPYRRDAARMSQLRLHFAIAALVVSCFDFRPLALGNVVKRIPTRLRWGSSTRKA